MAAMKTVVDSFYEAFQRKDGEAMARCYSEDVEFSDPVFPKLTGADAGAMWKMLCSRSADLEVKFKVLERTAEKHVVAWDAFYTFTKTNRRVHNRIRAELWMRDGKIFRHRDTFSFWKWAAQALGPAGLLLGWSPPIKAKVRSQAAASLRHFLSKK